MASFRLRFHLFLPNVALSLLIVGASVTASGCGGGGSSSGQVLRALGFFTEPSGTEAAPTASANQPDTGRSISLSQTTSFPNDSDNDSDTDGGFIGLVNNQQAAGLTTTSELIDYAIPNSSFPIPSDTDQTQVRIPPSGSGSANETFIQLQLISPGTMDFLRNHENSLPQRPFTLLITVTVEARSDSGDTFASNPTTYSLQVGN